MGWHILIAVALALALTWLALLVALWRSRPEGPLLREALRLLPDTLRLLRRLAADADVPTGARVRLWLLFAYLASPLDLVPDFLPVIGYADDAIITAVVLRSVVRRAGPDVIRTRWPGSPDGLKALWRLARLPNG
jgi:uncharacterized membrane protein YkvA (DUF1232 family)